MLTLVCFLEKKVMFTERNLKGLLLKCSKLTFIDFQKLPSVKKSETSRKISRRALRTWSLFHPDSPIITLLQLLSVHMHTHTCSTHTHTLSLSHLFSLSHLRWSRIYPAPISLSALIYNAGMLSRFSGRLFSVRPCATPWTVALQVPLSLGFSRHFLLGGSARPRECIQVSYVSCTGRWVLYH